MTLEAIEPHRLYRQIADRIGTLIARGEFAPGTQLVDLVAYLRALRPPPSSRAVGGQDGHATD